MEVSEQKHTAEGAHPRRVMEVHVVNGNHSLFYLSAALIHPETLVHTSPHMERLERNGEPEMFEVIQNHFHMEKLEE